MNHILLEGGKGGILYKNKKTRRLCNDELYAQKEPSKHVSELLLKAIGFIDAASNLKDIKNMPSYRLHLLKGTRKGEYAMDLGKNLDFDLLLSHWIKAWYLLLIRMRVNY